MLEMDNYLQDFNFVVEFVQRKSDLTNEEIKRLPISVINELYQFHMLKRQVEQGSE
jgi:hypothetical protein